MKMQNIINIGTMTLSNLTSAIPALYRKKLIPTVEALLASKWGRMVSDPQFRGQLIDKAEVWLKKHSDSPLAGQLCRLLDMLRPLLTSTEPLSKTKMLALAAAVLYVISTMDVIPDFLPLIGWLDDLGVISLVLRYVLSEQAGEQLTGIIRNVLLLAKPRKA